MEPRGFRVTEEPRPCSPLGLKSPELVAFTLGEPDEAGVGRDADRLGIAGWDAVQGEVPRCGDPPDLVAEEHCEPQGSISGRSDFVRRTRRCRAWELGDGPVHGDPADL